MFYTLLIFRRDFLEQSTLAEVFIAITQVLTVIGQNYHRHFEPHFSNVVDIIVGWHLESEQKYVIKHNCSKVLQSFQQCWENDQKFTLKLLEQLLEDIELPESFDKFNKDDNDQKSKECGSFIGTI